MALHGKNSVIDVYLEHLQTNFKLLPQPVNEAAQRLKSAAASSLNLIAVDLRPSAAFELLDCWRIVV
jgi:hypothetical protein